MLEDTIAQHGSKFIIAAVVVLLGLACLALVFWILRNRPSSPFVRGGRNRQPRLAVLDAAAIDTRRRLVLVRRDDVEHLLMIGGPSDIVVESRIVGATVVPVEDVQAAAAATERARPTTPAASPPVAAPPAPVRDVPPPVAVAQAPAERVSSMGQVLYGGGEARRDETPSGNRGATGAGIQPVRAAGQQPQVLPSRGIQPQAGLSAPIERPVAAQQPERAAQAAADALDQARQRVIATPASDRLQAAAVPAERNASVPDNPALVSEFERILEAEISANAAAARSPANTTAAGTASSLASKSREETEAEMARLLGEIAASRKA
ncbi:flagellar biosynthetic protein FliO [Rhizobium sp. TRM95111]|uniref:flagellar biosynthetic protein FliO n=1 Tax=Rhizobium alarense TaxID=2846851 RepID=UPI001F43B5D5|nr:flagellar biosynthetic protein FliO [Rhizobium alarense]MCF3642416.1 flagellar biosynthetic protein FliO [Rhizobium alarense]